MKRIMIGMAVVICTALAGTAVSGASPASASTAWRFETVPKVAGGTNLVPSVSCPVRGDCIATGWSNHHGISSPLAEHWDGSSWAIQSTPDPAGAGGQFFGLACPSADSCTAVGDSSADLGGEEPLAENWNGTRWTLRPVPSPAGAPAGGLNSVSCAATGNCVAVGWYFVSVGGDEEPLVEHWNGTSWTVMAVPLPPDTLNAYLGGVSCPTAMDCIAVGSYGEFSQQTGLFAERWNGSRWTVQVLPHPAGAAFVLNAVSCPSGRSCTAVGGSYTSASTFQASIVERWNGTGWSLQADAAPADTMLYGVSCPSGQACTAVGAAWGGQVNTYSKMAAESWDGTTWTEQTIPVPPKTIGAELNGISCLGPAYCTAAGGVNPGGPVAEHEG